MDYTNYINIDEQHNPVFINYINDHDNPIDINDHDNPIDINSTHDHYSPIDINSTHDHYSPIDINKLHCREKFDDKFYLYCLTRNYFYNEHHCCKNHDF